MIHDSWTTMGSHIGGCRLKMKRRNTIRAATWDGISLVAPRGSAGYVCILIKLSTPVHVGILSLRIRISRAGRASRPGCCPKPFQPILIA
jgi:hypothetical protein